MGRRLFQPVEIYQIMSSETKKYLFNLCSGVVSLDCPWNDEDYLLSEIKRVLEGKDIDINFRMHGKTLLCQALRRNNTQIARWLIMYANADVNLTEETGINCFPLYVAASYKTPELINMVSFICSHGANVNQKTTNSQTALGTAALSDNMDAAEILVTKGAQVNVMAKMPSTAVTAFLEPPNTYFRCPLDLALRRDYYDLAGKIVDAGAKPLQDGIMHMYCSLIMPRVPREEKLNNIELLKKMLCLGFKTESEKIEFICNELKKRTKDPLYNHLVECADLIASTKVCVPSLKVLSRNQVRIYVADSADNRHLKQKLQELEIPEELKIPLILKHSSDEFR